MRAVVTGLLATLLVGILCNSAYAEPTRLRADLVGRPEASAARVTDNVFYAVEISCGNFRPVVNPSGTFQTSAQSLWVAVTDNGPINFDAPSGVLSLLKVYDIGVYSDTRQTFITDNREACNRKFLVNGRKDLTITVLNGRLNNYAQSKFGTVLKGVLDLISPIFTLFMGVPTAPALLTAQVTSIGTVRTTVGDILTTLNSGEKKIKSLNKLQVGKYVVRGDYADISIRIRPVPSIVLDRDKSYRDDFKSHINGAIARVASPDQCLGAQYDISGLGFNSSTDKAFGLIHLAARASFTKPQMAVCLGPNYAPLAVKAGEDFWSGFPVEFRLRQVDIDIPAVTANQPAWETVAPRMEAFLDTLAGYTRNEPSESAKAELAQYFSPQIKLDDRTGSKKFGGPGQQLPYIDAINRLRTEKYIRYGCWVPIRSTDSALVPEFDGAITTFLTFNIPNDARATTADTALSVRPLFNQDRRVESLLISDDFGWVLATLGKRGNACKGLFVSMPKTN